MAGNSNFVLRWVIDNAAAVYAAGKAESKVFKEGGFQWNINMKQNGAFANFILGCGLNHHRNWKCEGKAHLRMFRSDGSFWEESDEESGDYIEKEFRFAVDSSTCTLFNGCYLWKFLTKSTINAYDKVTLEFHMHVTNSDRGERVPCIFDAPNNKSNVILKIGERKLHVSKEFLAIHSLVFDTLFFGDFAENGKEEVELNDIVIEEFLDLLNVVYLKSAGIIDHTVPHILKLADRFQMKHVLEVVDTHLTRSNGFDTVEKLIMADQYRLDALREHCLNSLKSFDEWAVNLESHPGVDISGDIKIAVHDRLMKLKQQSPTTISDDSE